MLCRERLRCTLYLYAHITWSKLHSVCLQFYKFATDAHALLPFSIIRINQSNKSVRYSSNFVESYSKKDSNYWSLAASGHFPAKRCPWCRSIRENLKCAPNVLAQLNRIRVLKKHLLLVVTMINTLLANVYLPTTRNLLK